MSDKNERRDRITILLAIAINRCSLCIYWFTGTKGWRKNEMKIFCSSFVKRYKMPSFKTNDVNDRRDERNDFSAAFAKTC